MSTGLLAFNRATHQHEALVRGRTYRVRTHDEGACMDGDCGGIVDRGLMTFVARQPYHDRVLGPVATYSFRQDGEFYRFSESYYTLDVEVAQ